jgi:SNF2 family DNA or RNA helicase
VELDYYGDSSDCSESSDEEEEDDDVSYSVKKTTTYDSCVDLDSLRQLLDVGGARDRTRNSGVKSNGDVVGKPESRKQQDLMDLSEKAESFLPKSVIITNSSSSSSSNCTSCANGGLRLLLHGGTLLDFQLVALDWLAALHGHRLPAVLADEQGLGRRVVVVAFIAHLVFHVCRPPSPPHLILCPVTAVARWEAVLRSWVPALRVLVYGGSASDRRRLRRNIADGGYDEEEAPHVILVSFAAFFSDAAWFLGRRWGEAVLAEVQQSGVTAAPDQLTALCQLKADHRLLVMSGGGGPQKENLIQLWSRLQLLFPLTHELHPGGFFSGLKATSSVADPLHFGVDPDPDPDLLIHASGSRFGSGSFYFHH